MVEDAGFHVCQICCSDVEADACTVMDCNHSFCDDCWRQHCKTQIDEGQARNLRCVRLSDVRLFGVCSCAVHCVTLAACALAIVQKALFEKVAR